jgi:hypothetical protein
MRVGFARGLCNNVRMPTLDCGALTGVANQWSGVLSAGQRTSFGSFPTRRSSDAKDLPVFMKQVPRDPPHKSRLTSSGVASYRRNARRAFQRCSAALLGSTALASRFVLEPPRRLSNRVAREEDRLFRRLSRLAPETSEGSFHCLPAEIGPSVACLALLPLPALWGGGDFRSR